MKTKTITITCDLCNATIGSEDAVWNYLGYRIESTLVVHGPIAPERRELDFCVACTQGLNKKLYPV